jgi:hypothetical protein
MFYSDKKYEITQTELVIEAAEYAKMGYVKDDIVRHFKDNYTIIEAVAPGQSTEDGRLMSAMIGGPIGFMAYIMYKAVARSSFKDKLEKYLGKTAGVKFDEAFAYLKKDPKDPKGVSMVKQLQAELVDAIEKEKIR